MMSVLEYAQDVNKTINEILDLCRKLNISVNGEDDYLDEEAIIELDNAIASDELEEDLEYEEELIEKVNEIETNDNKSYKIVLTGYKKIEISLSKIKKLIAKKNVIKIKDESKIEYDIEFLSKQNNLKGIYLLLFNKFSCFHDKMALRLIDCKDNELFWIEQEKSPFGVIFLV